MLEWISWFVIGVIYNVIYLFLYKKLVNNKNKIISIRNIGLVIFVSIMYCVSLTFKIKILMILFKMLWTGILLKLIYDDKMSKISVATFFMYLTLSISEMLFSLFFVYFLNFDLNFFKTNIIGILITNITIALINLFLNYNKFLRIHIRNIIEHFMYKKYIDFIIITIIAVFLIYIFTYQNYNGIFVGQSYINIIFFFTGIIIFIIGFFKEKTDSNKLTSEYDQLLQYVKTYEEVIEEKSKNQHEYQNQLILIKEMLGTRNKKVRDHISELLEMEDQTEKYNWLNKLKNIPNGGLKGLIHYKITEMMKKDIKLYVDINDNVNNKRINKYLNDNLHDISKIIGVYIDNAIEAAVESKQRYIIIEAMIENNKLDFSISNTYSGTIDFNSIDKEGYSKKGKGRGYGLSLVQDIINRRKDIDQYREFNGIFFVQHLIIDIHKKE